MIRLSCSRKPLTALADPLRGRRQSSDDVTRSGMPVREPNQAGDRGGCQSPNEREILTGIVAWMSTECWEDPAMDRATIYSLVRKLNERSLGHGS